MIEKEIARIKSELADISCQFIYGKTCEEKISEIFKNPLDKPHKVWYNKITKGKRISPTNRRKD